MSKVNRWYLIIVLRPFPEAQGVTSWTRSTKKFIIRIIEIHLGPEDNAHQDLQGQVTNKENITYFGFDNMLEFGARNYRMTQNGIRDKVLILPRQCFWQHHFFYTSCNNLGSSDSE
jgi:hypothetical protein